jgi:hypothetical protein
LFPLRKNIEHKTEINEFKGFFNKTSSISYFHLADFFHKKEYLKTFNIESSFPSIKIIICIFKDPKGLSKISRSFEHLH